MKYSPDEVAEMAITELMWAMEKHGPMKSAHEGYAVLLEEVDELWDEVRKHTHDPEKLRAEAIQVAAMGMRFVLDLCNE